MNPGVAVVLVISARYVRQLHPPVWITLDVFAPGGYRAATIIQ